MRRRCALVALLVGLLLVSSADAGWGHWRHGGWAGAPYGHRSVAIGWGGGWSGGWGGGWGCGPGWGGPAFGVSVCRPNFCWPGDCWGGAWGGGWGGGWGTPIGLSAFAYRPYGIDYNPASGSLNYFLPPTSEPAELNFGPQAVKQFMGLPRDFALGGLRNADALAGAAAALPLQPAGNLAERGRRISSPEMRRKAASQLAEGDELFRGQNFHAALQRYKLAANLAPDLAEPYWRQGHALVATHNFELASGSFKRAIALTDDLSRGGFRLSDLYAGAVMTKAQHLESLAGWALEREASADPYFLLGLFLAYDGQQERATKYFQRAADLAGFAGGHIAMFLDPDQQVPPAAMTRPPAVISPALAPREVPVVAGREI